MGKPPSGSPNNELKFWQRRIFWSVWVTYFAFYLCRYNMPMAKKRLCETYAWNAEDIGIVFSALLLMYAIGQFVNGQLADRFGTRRIASFGIFGSVAMNLAVFILVLVGTPESADPDRVRWYLTLFWGLNGFFQSMGWAPMVRVMAHWFPTNRRGKVMGLMGTCYQIGGAFSWFLAFFLTGYFAEQWGGDWRNVFLVPAILFAVVGVFFIFTIRNSPEEVGLPTVNRDEEGTERPTSKTGIFDNALRTVSNPYVWIVAGAFFFLDMNRYGFVNWLPAFLDEQAGQAPLAQPIKNVLSFFLGDSPFVQEVIWPLVENVKEVMKRCIHPLAGSAGAILAGWATDRFFGGRRAPIIVVLLLMLGISSILFPYIDPHNTWLVIAVVALIGFCTYGPHILMVGHAAQDFGKKSGAGGAAGFIDGMGYIGAALAGWGAGKLIDANGYEITFIVFGFAAIAGALLMALIWKVGPDTKKV